MTPSKNPKTKIISSLATVAIIIQSLMVGVPASAFAGDRDGRDNGQVGGGLTPIPGADQPGGNQDGGRGGRGRRPGQPPDPQQPAPQPVPQPVPQPAPQPAPQPMPQPEPRPNPRPRPQPIPQPDPVPAPQPVPQPIPQPLPDPVPAPAPQPQTDPEGARRQGYQDGTQAGFPIGQSDGIAQGRVDGDQRGRREGFEECEREARERAHDHGYHEGRQRGENQGIQEGNTRGIADGDAQGRTDGQADGNSRANTDAYNASLQPGRNAGYNDAEHSDARVRGSRDGVSSGNADALSDANQAEYPKGRQSVKDAKTNEAIQNQDRFAQKTPFNTLNKAAGMMQSLWSSLWSLTADRVGDGRGNQGGRGDHGGGDNRSGSSGGSVVAGIGSVSGPNRNYPNPDEQAAYNEGYNRGKTDGYNQAYRQAYEQASRASYGAGHDAGCQDARRRDYRREEEEGRQQGLNEGRQAGFDRQYAIAKKSAYDAIFPVISRNAYDAAYNGYYNQHFAEARAAANAEHVSELYQAARKDAHDQEYSRAYPDYANKAFNRGAADEEREYAERPLRIISTEIQESVVNGIYEPGEKLRVKLQLRNHSAQTLHGKDIRVQLEILNRNGIIATISDESLVKDLKPKSMNVITDALEFNLTEGALDNAVSVNVKVVLVGKPQDAVNLSLTAKYQLDIDFAEQPVVQEGLPTTIKLRVTNQAKAASEAGKLNLNSNPSILELVDTAKDLPSLKVGESTIVSFQVILRSGDSSVRLPISASVSHESGRVLGTMESVQELPVMNDYRISLVSDPALLRKGGVTRLKYSIVNVNKRLSPKSLQMAVRVINDTSNNFAVIGPNPQYVSPLRQGKSDSFVVPVTVKADNSGGVLELVVKEQGKVVVIHRAQF